MKSKRQSGSCTRNPDRHRPSESTGQLSEHKTHSNTRNLQTKDKRSTNEIMEDPASSAAEINALRIPTPTLENHKPNLTLLKQTLELPNIRQSNIKDVAHLGFKLRDRGMILQGSVSELKWESRVTNRIVSNTIDAKLLIKAVNFYRPQHCSYNGYRTQYFRKLK